MLMALARMLMQYVPEAFVATMLSAHLLQHIILPDL